MKRNCLSPIEFNQSIFFSHTVQPGFDLNCDQVNVPDRIYSEFNLKDTGYTIYNVQMLTKYLTHDKYTTYLMNTKY